MNPIDPKRTALLVMDLQPAVIAGVGVGEAFVAHAADAIARAREAGMHVGHVRVAFTDAERAAIPDANQRFSQMRGTDRLAYDDPDADHHPAVYPAEGDIAVRKTRVGAFSTTDLDARLRERGVDTLVLAGISTSGVVLSTVRDAADRDYGLVVLSDLVADRDAEVHRVLLEQVFPAAAQVVASAELLR